MAELSVTLAEREVAIIAAALRLWQYEAETADLEDAFISHFKRHRPLTEDEIDSLCRRLKFDESQGYLTLHTD